MKVFISLLLCLCLVLRSDCLAGPVAAPAPQPKPDACLACVLIVIGAGVAAVIIWGIWKMCKNIKPVPPSTNDPPDSVTSNVTPGTAPALAINSASGSLSLQSSADGKTWVTEASFTVDSDGTNLLFAAYDAASNYLGSASSALYSGGSNGPVAVADFSKLNLPGHPGPARLYRLSSPSN